MQTPPIDSASKFNFRGCLDLRLRW